MLRAYEGDYVCVLEAWLAVLITIQKWHGTQFFNVEYEEFFTHRYMDIFRVTAVEF